MRRSIVLGTLLVLAVGCGSGIDKKVPTDETNNGVPNNGVVNNGATNNGDVNNVVNNGGMNNVVNNGGTNNGVVNNGAGGCVSVSPSSLEFSATPVNTGTAMGVLVENCSSDTELELIAYHHDGPFRISVPEITSLPPLQVLEVPVRFEPTTQGLHQGVVSIETSAGTNEVAVSGEGISDEPTCPVSVAYVFDAGGNLVMDTSASVNRNVEFTASESYGRASDVANYEWVLLSRPQGSTSTFRPSANVENPTLFLDVAGDYVVELTVFDALGEPSCVPSQAGVTAVPATDGLRIDVTWNTMATDLDAHYLHPNAGGVWNQSPWDCFWLNRTPEWGAAGPSDDPSQDIDDVDGIGPESISHAGYEAVQYAIGVHFYADNMGPRPTVSTTRVYLDGVMVFEDVSIPLSEGQFREVGTFDGATGQVTGVGTVTVGFP